MSYCILKSPKAQQFLEITQTPNYAFYSENGRDFSCYNHNALLNMMAGAVSGKTGFTNQAGYCYVGALENQGRTFVVALLACGWPNHKNYKWADTRKLMSYGIENYYYRSFLDEEIVFDKKWLESIPVLEGRMSMLGEVPRVQVEVKANSGNNEEMVEGLLMKQGEEIIVQYKQEKILTAPVEAGTVVGKVSYSVDGVTYRTEEIVTKEGVEKIDFQWCLWQILGRFLVLEQDIGK